jgi:hypothetical protein
MELNTTEIASEQIEYVVYGNCNSGIYAVCEIGIGLLEQDYIHVIQQTHDFEHAVEIAILHNQQQIQTIYQIIKFQQGKRQQSISA